MMGEIYLYGMILATESILLCGDYPKPDDYAEIKERYDLIGGETGIAAAILSSFGCDVTLGGSHLGYKNAAIILDYFKNKSVDTSKLVMEDGFPGVMDCVMIDKDTRTCFGQFGALFEREIPFYEAPDEEAIKNCSVVGADPFFGEQIAELCVLHHKKYATIDCNYDSFMNQYCAVNAISHQHLKAIYPGEDYLELFRKYTENTEGLIIFTFGEKEIMYGRKGQVPKYFKPYAVDVVSTLGAGDSFKAGTIYGLYKGMEDDELVRFACATAAGSCANYPIPLKTVTLEMVENIMNGTSMF